MALPKNKRVREYNQEELNEYCQILFDRTGKPAKRGPCKSWAESPKTLTDAPPSRIDPEIFLRASNLPLKPLYKKELSTGEITEIKNEVMDEVVRKSPNFLESVMKQNPELKTPDEAMAFTSNEYLKDFNSHPSLETLINSDFRFCSAIGRRRWREKIFENIQSDKLKADLLKVFEWLEKYEGSYVGSHLLKQEISNMSLVAVQYIFENQRAIKKVKPHFKGKMGFYKIEIFPKKGNRVLVSGNGYVRNLNKNSLRYESEPLFSVKPLDPLNITLKISEKE